ncbi:hypothetical protein [Lyngbya sp. CCY1209]|uniref:hypothetical protein n=1 Tax=Lyngbya sp. CCY1209 TaxID=2886103 RepID=UPI002D203071|nr:hypothetical protein [Lyngbya sp. CCY1209]MEB3885406.1 hypothetical protein [Lyngbya sp. CCY1209]
MKKILTTLTGVSLLVLGGGVSPAAAFPPWAMPAPEPDEELIFNGETLDEQQTDLVEDVADVLGITATDLLDDPNQMDGLFSGDKQTGNENGWGVIAWQGCRVNADCAIQSIGLGLSIQCAASGMNPAAWAECVKAKNQDAYYEALQCTWQDADPSQTCDFLSSVDGENTYACNLADPAAALGRSSVEMPASLEAGQSRVLSINLI